MQHACNTQYTSLDSIYGYAVSTSYLRPSGAPDYGIPALRIVTSEVKFNGNVPVSRRLWTLTLCKAALRFNADRRVRT